MLNISFRGSKKGEDGTYSLAYADFIMPLVNAKKEEQGKISEWRKQINDLQKQNQSLPKRLEIIEDLKEEMNGLQTATAISNADKK